MSRLARFASRAQCTELETLCDRVSIDSLRWRVAETTSGRSVRCCLDFLLHERFEEVFPFDGFCGVEIGRCSCDATNTFDLPRGQLALFSKPPEKVGFRLRQAGKPPQGTPAQICVHLSLAVELSESSCHDALTQRS